MTDSTAIDLAGVDVGEQLLECRSVHVAACKPAVVVTCFDLDPTFATLACDVGRPGFTLGIE